MADLINAATNAGSGMPWSNSLAVSRPVHRRQVSPQPMVGGIRELNGDG